MQSNYMFTKFVRWKFIFKNASEIEPIFSSQASFIMKQEMKKCIVCVFFFFCSRTHERTHYTHAIFFWCLFSVRHLNEECRQKNEIKNVIRVYIEMWIQYLCIRIELIRTHKNYVRARTFDFYTTPVASILWWSHKLKSTTAFVAFCVYVCSVIDATELSSRKRKRKIDDRHTHRESERGFIGWKM